MANTLNPDFVLVDGSSYLYRAFYALPPLQNSKGEPTGAILGVANMIKRLLKDYPASYIAIVFDAQGKTFRDELFAEYKATRKETPQEIVQQFPYLKQLMQAMGLPVLQIEGVEADDVIGTLAMQARKEGLSVLISTGDKDMAQLVNSQITLINTMNQYIMDRQGVIDKFGITPEQIIDYLALIGDSSDNIPGIPKVGPKTAVKWLTQYGTLKNIIAKAHEISGVVGENLRNHLPQLELSYQLATIKLDVPLSVQITDLIPQAPECETLLELLNRLEFKAWLKEYQPSNSKNSISPAINDVKVKNANYTTIVRLEDLAIWIEKLKAADYVAIDTETNSLDSISAEIVGLSLAIQPDEAVYIPLAHSTGEAQLNREEVLQKFKAYLENPSYLKIAHNFKYDLGIFANHGIEVKGLYSDTMLESYVLHNAYSRHDLDSLAMTYLQYQTIKYEDVTGKGAKQISFAEVDLNTATHYAAEDADICLKLHQAFWPEIAKEKRIERVLTELEIPLIPVLSRMERHGVLIDPTLLGQQSMRLTQRIEEICQSVYDLVGREFNLCSTKQLQEILFDDLKLPILEKTPKGQPSTSESVLQELAHDFAIAKLLLEHRSLTKLKSTYTDALPKQIHPLTGRVHTSYNQAVTSTGRLSSTNPNLQNIPIKSEEGRLIRQAFIAPVGYKVVALDYSQIELRIMAHLSEDQGLLTAFAEGKDIHRATAAEVFNVSIDKVSDEQRRNAKAINFGLIYGMSAFGLARQLGIDASIAKNYIECYFTRYPAVKAYMENTRKQAHKTGYVETCFGRRLLLPDIHSKNGLKVRAAERAAINAPMQGTAADIIKKAMIDVDCWLKQSSISAAMILQVHDELVFEVHENQVNELIREVSLRMVNAAKLKVPLIVDVGVGLNWDEAH